MIKDKLSNSKRYEALHPGFKKAFDFIRNPNFNLTPEGEHLISEKEVYANISNCRGKGKGSVKLEKHREYIDIHVVLEGEDMVGWKSYLDCELSNGLPGPGKDAESFDDEPVDWITLRLGDFAVFFPEDAHAPMSGEGDLKKAVIKVALL